MWLLTLRSTFSSVWFQTLIDRLSPTDHSKGSHDTDIVKVEATYETIKKAEELEWTRNKIRDSGTLVTHLESVKDRF